MAKRSAYLFDGGTTCLDITRQQENVGMDAIAQECVHCRDRLSALERVATAHEARLIDHAESLSELEKKLDRLGDSNARIELLLERVLSFVTPTAAKP